MVKIVPHIHKYLPFSNKAKADFGGQEHTLGFIFPLSIMVCFIAMITMESLSDKRLESKTSLPQNQNVLKTVLSSSSLLAQCHNCEYYKQENA